VTRVQKAGLIAILAGALLVGPAAASAADTPPVVVSPAEGQVFSWEDASGTGVPLVVQAPAGQVEIWADVARDPGMSTFADFVPLFETSDGVYEGTALTSLWDPAGDPGTYYWRPYYYGSTGDELTGAGRSFVIKAPYKAPSLSVSLPSKLLSGRSYVVRLRYRAGSEPAADRLSLLATHSSCPATPGAGSRLVDAVVPPAQGELPVRVSSRHLGRLRLCAYVTSGTTVTRRASDVATVVRRPVSRARMRRWRLGFNGLGPVRIGMSVAAVERVTGRSMVMAYGEYAACEEWSIRGAPKGLSLMVAYGHVARIEAWRGGWRSTRGISIGDSEAKVLRRYHGVRTQPHPYVPPGKYLIVGGHRRMIFETNPAGRVTSFRGGRAREVGYIEGCL
jgi:hypothetical protein